MQEEIKIIDLFAGMGGLRLGFEQACKLSVKCILTAEIKPYALKVYNKFFKEEHSCLDVKKIIASQIPDFDYLLAGFPCQPFSFAGKGLGFEDVRGDLFFDILRILKNKNPKGFILENVEGLINHQQGRTLAFMISKLRELGYHTNYALLDSKDFGLAQSRKRVYIIGDNQQDIILKFENQLPKYFHDIQEHGLKTVETPFTKKLFSHYTKEELYGKSIKDKRGGVNNIHSWDIELKGKVTTEQKLLLNLLLRERRKKHWAIEIGIDWMDGMALTLNQITTFYQHPNLEGMLDDLVVKKYLAFEHPKKKEKGTRLPDLTKPKGYNIVTGKLSFEYASILDPRQNVPTLVATDMAKLGVIDHEGIRSLSLKEGLRLFGYPDDYPLNLIKQSEAFDLLGNTVCVPVISCITRKLIQKIYNKDLTSSSISLPV